MRSRAPNATPGAGFHSTAPAAKSVFSWSHWNICARSIRDDGDDDALARAVGALKALGAFLNERAFVDGDGDGGFLRRGGPPPVFPASPDEPLTVTRHVQFATYEPERDGDGGYTLHSDNGPASPGKASKNGRHVTAILYLNEGWSDDDGGHLELFPDSLDDPAVQAALLDQTGREWTVDDERALEAALQGHRSVRVAPRAGTVVVFDSRLVHTVHPATRTRRALTLWMSRPVDGDMLPCNHGEVYEYGGDR